MTDRAERHRIAITGIGTVSAIGHHFDEFVGALRSGFDGLSAGDETESGGFPVGAVVGWDPPPDARVSPDLSGSALRCEMLAVDAAAQALDHARWELGVYEPDRVGVYVGTCQGFVGAMESLRRQAATLALAHLAEDVARVFGFLGPAVTTTNACAAGSSAIALAFDALRRGRIDAALVGGADSLARFTVAGFASLHSLDPLGCSPYGRSTGLSVGEGAGMLLLERFETARQRGTEIVAELAGAAMSADAYHPTAPDPTGRGAVLAVTRALRSAGLTAADVDYVNGHGTGTPANDGMERAAFRRLFGDRSPAVPVSSTKSQIGHTLGAAGALEASACVASIVEGFLPPTIRQPPESSTEMDVVPTPGRAAHVDVAVSVSYAFGGSNAALVIRRPSRESTRSAPDEPSRVVLTGIGVVGGLGTDLDAWRNAVLEERSALALHDVGAGSSMLAAPQPTLTKRFASGSAWRKMDAFERAAVASAQMAWKDAAIQLPRERHEAVAVISGTNGGSVGSVIEYSEQLDRGSPDPAMFPHTAINAASGHVCTTMGFNGPNLSISTGGLSSIAAIEAAFGLLELGEIDIALVCCLDDMPLSVLRYAQGRGVAAAGRMTHDGVRPFSNRATGTAPGGAAVTLVLERESHAAERSATPWARVLATSMVRSESASPDDAARAWETTFRTAASVGGVDLSAIEACFAAAPGIPDADLPEALAMSATLSPACWVSAPKSIVGDCVGAAGAVNVVLAALALREGIIAANVGLEEAAGPTLRHVRRARSGEAIRFALANARSGGGSHGTVALEAWSATR